MSRLGSILNTLLLALAISGCSDGEHAPPPTSSSTNGAGGAPTTSSSSSAGSTAQGGAGGAAPVEVPLDGFGTIMGACGVLDDAELTGQMPLHSESSLDVAAMMFDYGERSIGGKKVHDDDNLGGSSLYSEVLAYEMPYRCELADLLKTEAEIAYTDAQGKKTDLIVSIDGHRIGVSVTRAVSYPPEQPFPASKAKELLDKKLAGVLASSANVAASDAWQKQVLLILAYGDEHGDALEQAWAQVDAATKADTLLLVTVTHGDDDFIYFDQ